MSGSTGRRPWWPSTWCRRGSSGAPSSCWPVSVSSRDSASRTTRATTAWGVGRSRSATSVIRSRSPRRSASSIPRRPRGSRWRSTGSGCRAARRRRWRSRASSHEERWRSTTSRPRAASTSRATSACTTASSSPSRITCRPSSTGTSRRAPSSRAGRAPASTCRGSAPRVRRSPVGAPPPARSASCAARMRAPAPSSRAARRAAPPRWSSWTSITPTCATSSGARPTRRRRRGRSATPDSTWTSTDVTPIPSSTRTRTTRCASPTSTCRPSRRTATGS